METANEIIVKASNDTGAVYRVKKCVEIVFRRSKMAKGEGLTILEERAEGLDPKKDDFYKFLGIEQGKQINKQKVLQRIKKEMGERLKSLVELELYDKNLMRAINCRVIPVAAYYMNVCQFTQNKLYDLDMLVKDILCKKGYAGPKNK